MTNERHNFAQIYLLKFFYSSIISFKDIIQVVRLTEVFSRNEMISDFWVKSSL